MTKLVTIPFILSLATLTLRGLRPLKLPRSRLALAARDRSVLAAFASLASIASLCACSGRKATCASYEVDGRTTLVEEACPRRGSGYDYVACGQAVREKT